MKISVAFIIFMIIFTQSKCNNAMIGQTFGSLTVLNEYPYKVGKSRGLFYTCQCRCGELSIVRGAALRSGQTKSCRFCGHKTHGRSKTREHAIWRNMNYRCNRTKGHDVHRYGGRGIKVCDRWANSFENFLADMGTIPSDAHSIDRIDNNGNYEPGNCRWATRKEQQNNTRTNRFITYNGITKTLVEWSREVGISPETLSARFNNGWSVEKSLTTPLINSKFKSAIKYTP